MNSQGPQQHSITEAAAEWAVRLHAGALSEQEQAELRQWIARDSRHEAALRFAEQTWAALGEVHKDEAVHRQRPPAPAIPLRRAKRRRPWQRAAAVALVLVAAGIGWVRGPDALLRLQADYVTHKGEVRTVHLADGSVVELDSDSAIRLEYDGVQRGVSLLQGAAIFQVAPMAGEETRPFVVHSAGGQTRALGTRFVVERETREPGLGRCAATQRRSVSAGVTQKRPCRAGPATGPGCALQPPGRGGQPGSV